MTDLGNIHATGRHPGSHPRRSEILFGGNLDGISEATFNDIVGEVPSKEIEKGKLDGAGVPLTSNSSSMPDFVPPRARPANDIEERRRLCGTTSAKPPSSARHHRRRPSLRQTSPLAQRQTQLRGGDGGVIPRGFRPLQISIHPNGMQKIIQLPALPLQQATPGKPVRKSTNPERVA